MGCCEVTRENKKQYLIISENYNFSYKENRRQRSINYNINSNNEIEERKKDLKLNTNLKSNKTNYKTDNDNISSSKPYNSNSGHAYDNHNNKTRITEQADINEFKIEAYQNNINSLRNLHNGYNVYNIDNNTLNLEEHNNENDISLKISIPQMTKLTLPLEEITQDLIYKRKKLILIVLESKSLEVGTQLIINAAGLEGSERMANDGVTIFGCRHHIQKSKLHGKLNKTDEGKSIENDFNFPNENEDYTNKDSIVNENSHAYNEKHFEIRYFQKEDNYKVKDLFGSGVYIKIKERFILKNNSIFAFINTHILINIDNSIDNNSILCIKFLYGEHINKEYKYSSSDVSMIIFGRGRGNVNSHCKYIIFSDNNISRVQCTIFYDNMIKKWSLVDSNGELESYNGTWFLAQDYYNLKETSIIKAGSTSFECGFIYQNNETYEEYIEEQSK